MLKILIIDDEVAAGNILKILIAKYVPEETEIVYCDNVNDALEVFESLNPSLVMLDIDMPGKNGFDFLNLTASKVFDVIFTTAYDQFAIRAIRFSALDYLLKPIEIPDLQNAIQRHIIRQYSSQQLLVSNLITNLKQKDSMNFKLALSTLDGVYFYDPLDILYCEGENNYTRFLFKNHKPMLVSKTLGDYEDLLVGHNFLRIHKSFLVNIKYVSKVDRDGVVMSDGRQLSISKRRKEMVMKHLKQH
jgi:two-component system LytT family response regulator